MNMYAYKCVQGNSGLVYLNASIHAHAHTYTDIHTYIHTYIHKYMQGNSCLVRLNACIHTLTYTHTHTHTYRDTVASYISLLPTLKLHATTSQYFADVCEGMMLRI
jgi:hypothetical protein